MSASSELPSVKIEQGCVVVLYLSAIDSSPCEDSIQVQEITQVIIERGAAGGGSIVHWYLSHRKGWTLHFNDQFLGANSVIQKLQSLLGFSIPEIGSIAGPGGEGTLVWPTV